MTPDQVSAVVHSNAMFPHGGPSANGFALVCSADAVAGCKHAAGRRTWIGQAPFSDEERDEVAALLEHAQFEVPFAELEAVEVHRAHEVRPGEIVVRTRSGEHKIGLAGKLARITGGGPDPDEVQDAVARMIEDCAPGKVHDVR